jgi:hypothetical protein
VCDEFGHVVATYDPAKLTKEMATVAATGLACFDASKTLGAANLFTMMTRVAKIQAILAE